MPSQPVNFPPVQHIEIRDGQARFVGRVLKVRMVISMLINAKASIEAVAEQYGLSRAEVHAALAYYYEHQQVIDQYFLEEDRESEVGARHTEEFKESLRSKLNTSNIHNK